MNFFRLKSTACLLMTAFVLASCKDQPQNSAKKVPPRTTIGHQVTRLEVHVGGTWGGGYSVDVAPEEYAVVEHGSCPDAKREDVPAEAVGLCVVRITKQQSAQFEAAMERFKRHAISLESFSFDDPYRRPDGKPCKNSTTDMRAISLIWTGTEGAKIATFYEGCDREELKDFYKSVLTVTEALPIQEIINKH